MGAIFTRWLRDGKLIGSQGASRKGTTLAAT